jgi:hypothetical protein
MEVKKWLPEEAKEELPCERRGWRENGGSCQSWEGTRTWTAGLEAGWLQFWG